jgi:hypothetical protein
MGVFTRLEVEGNTKGQRDFKTGSGLPEDNNPTSCVLIINDLLLFKVLLPLLLYPRGQGYKEGTELVTIMIPI